MDKNADFKLQICLIEDKDLAVAGVSEEFRNPLLTWVKLIFADDQPNANKQGIAQEEFPNLIRSMSYMPIKADFKSDTGVSGHDGASIIGVLKEGQQEGNKIVAVGALFNSECPEVIDYFKEEVEAGKRIDFSWEIKYKDSDSVDGVEWLKGTTTRAITAVKNPAYQGRTPLVAISSFDWIKIIDEELKRRATSGVGVV